MTPLMIEILLHYHCSASPFPRIYAPAVQEAIRHLIRLEILYEDNMEIKADREATQPYIDALCSIPLPVKKWEIPEIKKLEMVEHD
jgi:hypothetical protein